MTSHTGTETGHDASSASLTIRDATEADLPAIVALYANDTLGATRERVEDPLPEPYRVAFAEISEDPRARLVVVEADGEIVGTLQLNVIPHVVRLGAKRAQIESVRVAASHRGSGVGQRMITWAIEEARRNGCALVQLTTDASRKD